MPVAIASDQRPVASAWLFSRRIDLWVFLAPAVVALAVTLTCIHLGVSETPTALWLLFVVGVDVSHVWSTGFRVYADPNEVRRRPWLYVGLPLVAYLAGVALHLAGSLVFWRALAYAAVFHFIRQQAGWLKLYRRRAGERGRLGAWIDGSVLYLSMLYPLIWWHTHLPRHFEWFLTGDFVTGLPGWAEPPARAAFVLALAAYVVHSVATRSSSWGKHLLVGSTAVCWYVGIVTLDSDVTFTATNVLIHGVPYFALVFLEARRRTGGDPTWPARLLRLGWPAFYLSLIAIAFCEEGLWDRLVWHDHPRLFGESAMLPSPLALSLLVPLLALPQLTHYLLDAFIWKTRANPGLAERLELAPEPAIPTA
jgi:hypothetical protein